MDEIMTPDSIVFDAKRTQEIERMLPLTNTEFIEQLMNNNAYGPLTQSYVIEAIRFYSEKITEIPEPKDDPSQFISPKLWHQIAAYALDQIKMKYERK